MIKTCSVHYLYTNYRLCHDTSDQDQVLFVINKLFKQSEPGHQLKRLCFQSFHLDSDNCVVNFLDCYLRENCSSCTKLYSTIHNSVSRETSFLIQTVLYLLGIDVAIIPFSMVTGTAHILQRPMLLLRWVCQSTTFGLCRLGQ